MDTNQKNRRERWVSVMVERGHTPITCDGGDPVEDLDIFAYDTGHKCNGPGCSKCRWGTCWHCNPDPKKVVPLKCGCAKGTDT